jgi:cyclic nucleotide-binding protein
MGNLWVQAILDGQSGEAGGPVRQLYELLIDPGTSSPDAIWHGLERVLVASMTLANFLAVLGAIFFLVTLLARTIVPLRVAGLISSMFFVSYGLAAASFSTFLLYILLLPINVVRLYQMVNLVKKARRSASGDLSFDWLKPFMTRRNYRKGDFLCRKGERASEMFYTVTGKVLVTEIGVELPEGRILGELGFLSPGNVRTQTVQCIEDSAVLVISYDKLLELYFQNPKFGYYLLRLTSDRLLQNVARLESVVDQYRPKLAALTSGASSGPPIARRSRLVCQAGRKRITIPNG